MSKTVLIIVTGPPGSGKTTLAKKIADKFDLPFISRDAIKESMFDSLGTKDRQWSEKLGAAAYDLLYDFAEELMSKKVSFVIESNFKPEFSTSNFVYWGEKYDFETLQIHCEAEVDILFERFKNRFQSGERHPGHGDENYIGEFKEKMSKGAHGPIDIPGKKISLNTNDFSKIDHEMLLNTIQSWIKKA